MGERRGHLRALAAGLAGVVACALIPGVPVAVGSTGPYEHVWQVQGEVGGDRGGRSALTVLSDAMSLESVGGGYRGTISYSDRIAAQDAHGSVLVQVSTLSLKLVGAPATGGAAIGGTFNGTAHLVYYAAASWADAAAGRLPAQPSGTVDYDVTGHWGARMAGSVARGELEFGSATPRRRTGTAVERDGAWFGPADASPQLFVVEVVGAVSPTSSGGEGSGTSAVDYIRRGVRGGARYVVPVPADLAAAARALRDARPVGAVMLPANTVTIDIDIAGHTLDAKNRAAGARAGADGAQAASAWSSERARLADAVGPQRMAAALDALLAPQSETGGARELRAQIGALMASSSGDPFLTRARIAEWFRTASAVVDTGRPASVLAATARVTERVARSRVARGTPAAGALLAAADSLDAPAASRDVRRFERATGDDLPAVPDGAGAIASALRSLPVSTGGRPVVRWTSVDGSRSVEPAAWQAFRRSDATVYLLPDGAGDVALTDGSLTGWAFTERRAYLVQADRVGRLLAVLPATR